MKHLKKFDNYIKGELSEDDMETFTKEIITEHFEDESLKEKWAEILDKDEELKALQLESKSSDNINQPRPSSATATTPKKQKPKGNIIKMILQIAAAVLLLVAAGTFLMRGDTASNYQQLTAQHLEKAYAISSQRSAAEENEQRISANEFYRAKRYKEAIPIYNQLIASNVSLEADQFYLGLSHLYAGDAAAALPALSALAQNKDAKYAQEANWYLSLAQIKSNQLVDAKKRLQTIVDRGGWKSREAAELLKTL